MSSHHNDDCLSSSSYSSFPPVLLNLILLLLYCHPFLLRFHFNWFAFPPPYSFHQNCSLFLHASSLHPYFLPSFTSYKCIPYFPFPSFHHSSPLSSVLFPFNLFNSSAHPPLPLLPSHFFFALLLSAFYPIINLFQSFPLPLFIASTQGGLPHTSCSTLHLSYPSSFLPYSFTLPRSSYPHSIWSSSPSISS